MNASEIRIRRLQSIEEYRCCVELQREIWGKDFADTVPLSILKVGQRIGGVTAGAFTPDGEMIGFVFGLTGVENGRIVHWSDMLAVRRGARDIGLGFKLKCFQRDVLLPIGVEVVYWTFDPLEAKNAHFNLNKLGAEIHEYVTDMYGDNTSSTLHEGLGTDRFVAAWRIGSERVKAALKKPLEFDMWPFDEAPVVNASLAPDGTPVPDDGKLVEARYIRVEVPANIQHVKKAKEKAGAAWRACTRRAFQHYLKRGYTVTTIYRDNTGRCYYVLETNA